MGSVHFMNGDEIKSAEGPMGGFLFNSRIAGELFFRIQGLGA